MLTLLGRTVRSGGPLCAEGRKTGCCRPGGCKTGRGLKPPLRGSCATLGPPGGMGWAPGFAASPGPAGSAPRAARRPGPGRERLGHGGGRQKAALRLQCGPGAGSGGTPGTGKARLRWVRPATGRWSAVAVTCRVTPRANQRSRLTLPRPGRPGPAAQGWTDSNRLWGPGRHHDRIGALGTAGELEQLVQQGQDQGGSAGGSGRRVRRWNG